MKDTSENIESLLLSQFPGDLSREEYATLVQIWEASTPALNKPVFDTAAAWKKISGTLSADGAATTLPAAVNQSASAGAPRRIPRYSWLAAACLLFAVAAVWYLGTHSRPREKTIIAVDGNRTVIFPDSTTVYLRKGSKLSWSESSSAGKTPRVATLLGEAFFEIRHNPASPFRIDTRQATIEDLGTSFAISQKDTTCRVVVTAGSVKCTARNSRAGAVILTAGDQALLDAAGWTKYAKADSNFLAWKDQTLQFDQSSLDSVLAAVQDRYGIILTLSADIRSKADKIRVTARFGAHESLKDVLEEIRLTTGLGMQQKEDTIIFFQR